MQTGDGSAPAGQTAAPAGDGQALARAHADLLSDRSLQFDLAGFGEPEVPTWARWIGDLLQMLAPLLQWVFWIGLAAIAALLLFAIGREILSLRAPRPGPARSGEAPDAEWRPARAAARDLLAQADALAAEGRFAEAAHLLLLRSVEDMERRQPRALAVSMTAREIATHRTMPEAARPAFALIAAVVERSLFGGAAVDAAAFSNCRRAYEAFALPQGWTA